MVSNIPIQYYLVDTYMEPEQVQTLSFKENLGVVAMKWWVHTPQSFKAEFSCPYAVLCNTQVTNKWKHNRIISMFWFSCYMKIRETKNIN